MAQTLAQAEFLDRDMILRGVVDWLVMESPLTGVLPMMPVQGNALKYNVSTALPTSSWLAVKDQIVENTGTWEQRSTDIYTLIQDANTDKSTIALNSTQNPEDADIELAAQSMAHEFEKTLIIGQTSVDSTAKQFKGLLRILAELETASTTDLDGTNNSQVIGATTSGALTMTLMDQLVDQIKPGKPDLLLMSKRARRKLNTLSRASGSSGLTMQDSDLFGIKMEFYGTIPIVVSDWLLDNFANNSSGVTDIAAYDFDATRAGNTDNTVIFALQLGERKVSGLMAGAGMTHERSDPSKPLEDFNAIKNRFVWYNGLACFAKFSLAALTGINPDD